MKNIKKKVAPRNFVAKNALGSGAGRHKDKKNDYKRQPKHRNNDGRSFKEKP